MPAAARNYALAAIFQLRKIDLDSTEKMLQALTEAHGVPGYESEARAVLRSYLEPLGDLSQDKLGSLICRQPGDGAKLLLAAHMDEIGFFVKHISQDGFIKFLPLGGWWDQILLGHRVTIKTRKGDVTGVIGAKPPHLLPAKERNELVTKNKMYIDVGATSLEEVKNAGIRVGDPIIPQSNFEVMASGKSYISKAFDNRIGCAVVIDVLRHFAKKSNQAPNDLFGFMTTMEEIGGRGATTGVRMIDPDIAIILESGIAGDVPGIEPEESDVKLGKGVDLSVYDASMIPNIALRNLVIDTAEELDIPLQLSTMSGGGTDGGEIHRYGFGVPTVVLAVPARHIHSHSSIIHRDDYDNTVKLVSAIVKKLDADTVANLTS